ncbi:unnamed protein product [Prunus armeniaca]
MKVRSKEFGMENLSSTQEVRVAQLWHGWSIASLENGFQEVEEVLGAKNYSWAIDGLPMWRLLKHIIQEGERGTKGCKEEQHEEEKKLKEEAVVVGDSSPLAK